MWLYKQICYQFWVWEYKRLLSGMLLFFHEIRDDPQVVKGMFSGEEELGFEKIEESMDNYQRWGQSSQKHAPPQKRK